MWQGVDLVVEKLYSWIRKDFTESKMKRNVLFLTFIVLLLAGCAKKRSSGTGSNNRTA